MEYFNKYDSVYERALRNFRRHYKLKLELLTYGETVIDEIVKDISLTAMGQITKSSEQLNRTACNLTLKIPTCRQLVKVMEISQTALCI